MTIAPAFIDTKQHLFDERIFILSTGKLHRKQVQNCGPINQNGPINQYGPIIPGPVKRSPLYDSRFRIKNISKMQEKDNSSNFYILALHDEVYLS